MGPAFLEIQKDPVMYHVKFRNDSSVAPRSGHPFGAIRCHLLPPVYPHPYPYDDAALMQTVLITRVSV